MITQQICSFGDSHCKTLPAESGMCPRHEFMVTQMGLQKAEMAEIGLPCSLCCERFFDENGLKDCEDCSRLSVCVDCLEDSKCCMEELEYAQDELGEARDRVSDLEQCVYRKQREAQT